jgi:hypothetical protein
MKKLKSSLPVQKEKVWIDFALEKVNLTSSADVGLKKRSVRTLSFRQRARHRFDGCAEQACIF